MALPCGRQVAARAACGLRQPCSRSVPLCVRSRRHATQQAGSRLQQRLPTSPPAAAAGLQAGGATLEGVAPIAGSVLFLGPVWPERSSSAAGVRTSDLLEAFQQRGWAAACASGSAPNQHTEALAAAGVATHQCQPNREHQLSQLLEAVRATAVVFDRFYAEEAFSFRVRELAPGALRIVDMQDFHALRAARRQLADAGAPLEQVLACRPDSESAECLRELAAIHRSDLTLVCSPVELRMLAERYQVPAGKLVLAPYFTPPSPYAPAMAAPAPAAAGAGNGAAGAAQPGGSPPFSERRHFLMIGNWRHPPNLDSARWACSEVWPALRAALPAEHRGAELHMYGAYPAGAAQQLHNPKAGVHMKGFAPSLDIMLQYRVLLAPLRYGAGLKGKVVDSWWHGLPVVTTPIGAEGMHAADADATDLAAAGLGAAAAAPPRPIDPAADGYVWQLGGADGSQPEQQQQQEDWGGLCGSTTAAGIAASAALLYSEERLWQACQRRGFQLLQLLYNRERNLERVHDAIAVAAAQLEERRRRDFTGSMLWQQQARATEFFSRWVELKEAGKAAQQQGQREPSRGGSSAGRP